jgi:hypothetical protein
LPISVGDRGATLPIRFSESTASSRSGCPERSAPPISARRCSICRPTPGERHGAGGDQQRDEDESE